MDRGPGGAEVSERKQLSFVGQIGERIVHTSKAHLKDSHKDGCGCATRIEDVVSFCTCGAAYTGVVFSFNLFRCYDCGLVRQNKP